MVGKAHLFVGYPANAQGDADRHGQFSAPAG